MSVSTLQELDFHIFIRDSFCRVPEPMEWSFLVIFSGLKTIPFHSSFSLLPPLCSFRAREEKDEEEKDDQREQSIGLADQRKGKKVILSSARL